MLQSNQVSQINDQTKIRPTDLYSCESNFPSEIKSAGFGWRWKFRGDKSYRVLTIEGNSELAENDSFQVKPLQLFSKDPNFTDGLAESQFNWRWFLMNDGIRFRAVTIEKIKKQNSESNDVSQLIHLEKLLWIEKKFQEEIEPLHFNWRWFNRAGFNYKLVTLE